MAYQTKIRLRYFFLGIFVLLVLAFAWFRIPLHFRVKSSIQAIRAEGSPMSPQEVNAWLLPAEPALNGAILIWRAFYESEPFPDTPANIRRFDLIDTYEWTPEVRDLVAKHIAANSKQFETLEQALNFPRFRYVSDFSNNRKSPHLDVIRLASRNLALRTALAAEQNAD